MKQTTLAILAIVLLFTTSITAQTSTDDRVEAAKAKAAADIDRHIEQGQDADDRGGSMIARTEYQAEQRLQLREALPRIITLLETQNELLREQNKKLASINEAVGYTQLEIDGVDNHVRTISEQLLRVVNAMEIEQQPDQALEDKAPININTADKATLDLLPEVGPPTAQKIIDARPYNSVDELDNKVDGIGPATLDEIRPYVTVD